MLVDSHAHLFEIKGYSLPEDIFPVIVGYSHGSNQKALALATANKWPFILGIAPQSTIKEGLLKLDEWVAFIRSAKPNAIGEVGLDYKWAQTKVHVENERVVFNRMIMLAKEMKLPLVIHSRNKPASGEGKSSEKASEVPVDAIEDVIRLMGENDMRFLMHFYSGSAEQAERIVALGGHISVTHMRSKERRKVINSVPLDRLLVESDSPYVGRTPDTIRDAVSYIAEVKGLDIEVVAKATTENAMRFFGFKL